MRRVQHHPKLAEIEVTYEDRIREEGRTRGLATGLERGRVEGRIAGRQEGLAQGLATGRVKGRRELLVGLLEGRFGDLSEPVRQKVERIGSEERLDELAKKLLVARSLDELGLG